MDILKVITSVLSMDKFLDLFKGKETRLLEFQIELSKQLQEANLAQLEVNKEEAKHQNIFVSGWRPFIGWICGSALAYQFVFRDLISLIFELGELPQLDISQLVTILTAMLGMSTLRTFEKIKKVN